MPFNPTLNIAVTVTPKMTPNKCTLKKLHHFWGDIKNYIKFDKIPKFM